ncbi:MAG: hypothetical protein AAFO99_06015 [Bacteroidota bacterium]
MQTENPKALKRFVSSIFYILQNIVLSFSKIKNPHYHVDFLFVVGHTGFEPVTSALSRQRSKPTELMDQERANVGYLAYLKP